MSNDLDEYVGRDMLCLSCPLPDCDEDDQRCSIRVAVKARAWRERNRMTKLDNLQNGKRDWDRYYQITKRAERSENADAK
jgi:hypothetical protein